MTYATRTRADSPDPIISTSSTIVFDHPKWMQAAACNGLDPNLFHPERGESSHHAKAVCDGCAVRELCADYAIEHRIAVGIWGGTSGRERRRLIAANVLALVPTLPSAACGEPDGPETTENAEEANNAVYGTEVA
jgi:WhiB family redox-sensing transcriptional regulator